MEGGKKGCTSKNFTKKKKQKRLQACFNRELYMYPRRYPWVLTFNRHSCAAAFRFWDLKAICYHSLLSRSWVSVSTEVPQQTMSVFESLTLLLTEQEEKYLSEELHEICWYVQIFLERC